ncbi:hypothetical protein ACMD2_19803 [Ananas comosus]|uniref:DUF8040 domain-containing protein n=1 Tax=Ananas comosus TaxID=4615 RepID=A0A199W877_ANACO|nr:hypothetical protein ACMD2_19803 [Ananas comosus]
MIADQQLAIFLFGVDNSVANRILAETFQHSGETISRYFNNGVRGIVRLKDEYIMFPSSNVVVHPNNIVVQIGFSRKHSNIQEKLSVDILTTLMLLVRSTDHIFQWQSEGANKYDFAIGKGLPHKL